MRLAFRVARLAPPGPWAWPFPSGMSSPGVGSFQPGNPGSLRGLPRGPLLGAGPPGPASGPAERPDGEAVLRGVPSPGWLRPADPGPCDARVAGTLAAWLLGGRTTAMAAFPSSRKATEDWLPARAPGRISRGGGGGWRAAAWRVSRRLGEPAHAAGTPNPGWAGAHRRSRPRCLLVGCPAGLLVRSWSLPSRSWSALR